MKEVLDSTELFPSEMLDDMMSDYLGNPDSEELWFTCLTENLVVGLAYCAPEKLTNGTYNLYAIAVKKDCQGQGIGRKMMTYIEDLLRQESKRVLIVDTSSGKDYELTRKFYLQLGYHQESVIRDFWDEGEDKVTFWKKLQ